MTEQSTRINNNRKPANPDLRTELLQRRYVMKDAEGRVIETPGQMFERVAAAVASAEEAVALTSERGERIAEIHAQIELAEAQIARDGSRARAVADSALARAEALVRETGAGAYTARVDQVRANLAHSCGEPEARAQHLKAALAGYQATGATGCARSIEATLASL